MVSATDGSAFTGSVTVAVTLDAGTQATGSVGSGACTHEGNGYHTYAPAQAETNGDLAAFTFTGTGAVPATVQIYTAFPQTGDSFARIGAPVGASISADLAGVQSDTDNIQTRIPAALVSGRIDASVGAYQTGLTPLQPATAGRTLVVDAAGLADANTVKLGPTGAGTAQTARDLGTSVLLSSGTGTGQLSLSSGAVLLQATQTGVTIPTVTTLTNAPSDSSGVTTLLSRLPAGLFTGLTNFAQWLGLLAGKQTGNSAARTEVRATGAGSGTFDETTDSVEALRDRGDAAYLTATGFATPTNITAASGVALTAAYDAAKTASQAGDVMKVSSGTGANQISLSSGLVTAGTVNDKTGYALTAAYDDAKTAAQAGDAMTLEAGAIDATALDSSGKDAIADSLLDRSNAIETGLTPRNALRLTTAAAAGDVTGLDTGDVEISSAVSGTKTRITATGDAASRTITATDLT